MARDADSTRGAAVPPHRSAASLTVSAGVLASAQYLAGGIGFLTSVIVARLLGPEGYGAITLVLAYPTLVWSAMAVKSVMVLPRYLSSFRAARRLDDIASVCKLGYGLDFISATVALALVAGTARWIAYAIYQLPDRWWLMVAAAAAFPVASLSTTSASVLLAWGRFRRLAMLQSAGQVVSLLLVVAALLLGLGITGVVLSTALGSALTGVILTVGAARVLHADGVDQWWKARLRRVRPMLAELRASFGWSYVVVTMGAVITQFPVIVLGRLRGPEEAGLYRIASSIMTVGAQLEGSMGQVAYSDLSARWSHGEAHDVRASLRRWTVWPGLPAGASMALAIPVVPFVVALVFGREYVGIVPGAQMMLISVAIGSVFFWLNALYLARGDFGALALASTAHAILIVGLGWFAAAQWGFIGLAALAAAGRVFVTGLLLVKARRILPRGAGS